MSTKRIIRNVDLREELCSLYSQLKTQKVPIEDAKALANVAGKIIKSAQTELAYLKLKEQYTHLEIQFLEQ